MLQQTSNQLLEEVGATTTLGAMWIGWTEYDILLDDPRSLKQKRSMIRPVIAQIRRKFPQVSVAETTNVDLLHRGGIGLSLVGAERSSVQHTLEAVENMIHMMPEITVLSAQTRVLHSEDL